VLPLRAVSLFKVALFCGSYHNLHLLSESPAMEKPYILHMFTTEKNLSPFDVNMALDAGWTSAIPYLQVEASEIQGLVQDAIFSRGPAGVKRTGIFIGGRDAKLAADMVRTAQKSMVPPFEVSVFADP